MHPICFKDFRSAPKTPGLRVETLLTDVKRQRSQADELFLWTANDAGKHCPAQTGKHLVSQFVNFDAAAQWLRDLTRTRRISTLTDETLNLYASSLHAWGAFVDALSIFKGSQV